MTLKKEYISIGIMSGTSLDGLDIALCRFSLIDGRWEYNLLDTQYFAYDNSITSMLKHAYTCTAREFVEIDIEFGRFIGDKVRSFIVNKNIDIDLVASHGHTIFHAPDIGYTRQIGSGAAIAGICELPVVVDFRQQDIVYGGQGAPLVPIGDELLFGDYSACLNLGGFANISYKINNKRIAYDICAVNFILNSLARRIGHDFDKDGDIASTGNLDNKLLKKLEDLPFYRKNPPKSLGQEWVEFNITPFLANYSEESMNDCLRTYAEHIALQISKIAVKIDGKDIFITGGGAKNKFLINRIRELSGKSIVIPEIKVVDFKEAIIFAFLGVLRWCNMVNSLASVTGAKKDSCCGAVYIP